MNPTSMTQAAGHLTNSAAHHPLDGPECSLLTFFTWLATALMSRISSWFLFFDLDAYLQLGDFWEFVLCPLTWPRVRGTCSLIPFSLKVVSPPFQGVSASQYLICTPTHTCHEQIGRFFLPPPLHPPTHTFILVQRQAFPSWTLRLRSKTSCWG